MIEQIKLHDLVLSIMDKKYFFFSAFLLLLASLTIYSYTLPVKWTSDALLVSVDKESQSSSAAAGMLSNLAGINLGGQSGRALDRVKRKIATKDFYKILIQNSEFYRDLIAVDYYDPVLKINNYNEEIYDTSNEKWIIEPSFFSGYRKYLNTVSAGYLDEKSGIFLVVKAEHSSPEIAKMIVDEVIIAINESQRENDIVEAENTLQYLSGELGKANQISIKSAINGLIENQLKLKTFAYVKENYIVKAMDRAYVPDSRSSPNRLSFVLIGIFIGMVFMISVHTILFIYRKQ